MNFENDYDAVIILCVKNGFNYREIPAYDEKGKAYPCIWFNTGHIEFDNDKMIKNIVTY